MSHRRPERAQRRISARRHGRQFRRQEWPTRITGLLTLPIVAFVTATSSAVELRPYCDAMHSYPSACRGTINLLKQEPSAQSPWQNTMLGLDCISFSSVDGLFLACTAGRPEIVPLSR